MMEWKAERYPQDQKQIADHRIMDEDKVIAFCPTGYPFSNAELMASAPALLDETKKLWAGAQRAYVVLDKIPEPEWEDEVDINNRIQKAHDILGAILTEYFRKESET